MGCVGGGGGGCDAFDISTINYACLCSAMTSLITQWPILVSSFQNDSSSVSSCSSYASVILFMLLESTLSAMARNAGSNTNLIETNWKSNTLTLVLANKRYGELNFETQGNLDNNGTQNLPTLGPATLPYLFNSKPKLGNIYSPLQNHKSIR